MKQFTQLLLLMVFSLSGLFAQARPLMGREGGGGDSDVVEFLGLGNQLQKWLEPRKIEGVDVRVFSLHLDGLRERLDTQNTAPRIVFQDSPVLCEVTGE